jgi:hypothetical protein
MNNKLKPAVLSVSILGLGIGYSVDALSASAIYTPIAIDNFGNPNTYNKAGEIDFDKVMFEIFDPLTDEPTGDYAVFHAPRRGEYNPQTGYFSPSSEYKDGKFTLDVMPGFKDVRISPDSMDALGHSNTVHVVTIVPDQNNGCTTCQNQLTMPVCIAGQIGYNLSPEYTTSDRSNIPAFSMKQESFCLPSVEIENWALIPGMPKPVKLKSECYKMTLDTATTQTGILKIKSKLEVSCN